VANRPGGNSAMKDPRLLIVIVAGIVLVLFFVFAALA
jgi:hypothetical protein